MSAYSYVNVSHVFSASADQKGSDLLELKLQTVVNHHVGAGNGACLGTSALEC